MTSKTTFCLLASKLPLPTNIVGFGEGSGEGERGIKLPVS